MATRVEAIDRRMFHPCETFAEWMQIMAGMARVSSGRIHSLIVREGYDCVPQTVMRWLSGASEAPAGAIPYVVAAFARAMPDVPVYRSLYVAFIQQGTEGPDHGMVVLEPGEDDPIRARNDVRATAGPHLPQLRDQFDEERRRGDLNPGTGRTG